MQMGPVWSKAVQYQQAIHGLIQKRGRMRLLAGENAEPFPLPAGFTRGEWLKWSGGEIAYAMQEADTYTISESVSRAVLEAAKTLPNYAEVQPYHFPTRAGVVYLEASIDADVFYPSEMVREVISMADPGVKNARLQAIFWNTLTNNKGEDTVFVWAALDLSDVRVVVDSIFPISVLPYALPIGEMGRNDAAGRRVVAFLMALLFFMEQKVFVAAVRPLTRAQRKQAPQWYKSQEERVITLRKREYTNAPSGDHREVDWQYQWLVRGHWRKQYYPARNEHRTIWIAPFSKGPEDKPLKPPTKHIFQVVR